MYLRKPRRKYSTRDNGHVRGTDYFWTKEARPPHHDHRYRPKNTVRSILRSESLLSFYLTFLLSSPVCMYFTTVISVQSLSCMLQKNVSISLSGKHISECCSSPQQMTHPFVPTISGNHYRDNGTPDHCGKRFFSTCTQIHPYSS